MKRPRTMRRTFLTGVVVILPILITVWVIRFIFNQMNHAITPAVLQLIRWAGFGEIAAEAWVDYVAPLASVLLGFLLIYLLGLIGGNVFGRQIIQGVERLVTQIPVVRGIYSATRQFLETFSRDSRAFREVVLVEYPREGLWTVALLTNEIEGEVQAKTGDQVVSVFVPTTPNPTSGWLLFVPKKDVVELEMTVDDAFKLIISGGVLSPPYQAAPEPTEPEPSA